MANKFLIVCAVIVLSVNLAYAVNGSSKVNVSPAPPNLVIDPATGIELVYVKGGCYQMGNIFASENEDGMEENELPVHEVCVDDFYMGKYEVTQGQWKSIIGSNTLASSTCGRDNCPIGNVGWNDVQDFISRLNSRSGASIYRLPTEAEWEYAARSGGKSEKYSGGKDVYSVARFKHNSETKEITGETNYITYPVGTRSPNGLGIYDMSGNVWEMTNDWYADHYYSISPRNNPTGPSSGDGHTLRGGCTGGGIENQRTSRRKSISEYAVDRKDSIGFRIVRTCWNEAKKLCVL